MEQDLSLLLEILYLFGSSFLGVLVVLMIIYYFLMLRLLRQLSLTSLL